MVTINPEFRRVSDRTSRVCSPASVLPDVGVVHTGDDQHAGSRSNHRCCDAGTRVKFLALETPSDGNGHISFGDDAGQLGKFSRINHRFPKCERNDLRWL